MQVFFVKTITFDSGKWIQWLYDASGTKLRKTTADGAVTNYVNGIEYNGTALEAIYHGEGRAFNNAGTFRYEYALKDHLGNTRITFADVNNDNTVTETEILQESHFYPFRLVHEGNGSLSNYRYLYNGKERNADYGLEWYDYGARWQDPAAGRWWSVDALADDAMQVDKSPYAYAWDNPVKLADPDGNCPLCGLAGAVAGALVGGAIEAGIQLYQHGEVKDWNAVGGASVQGAITGGIAGLTGGASLLVASGANVVGGAANNIIQGKAVTARSVATDAVVGAGASVAGKVVGLATEKAVVTKTLNKLAQQAQENVMQSTGTQAGQRGFGTAAHSELQALVKAKGMKNVVTEISYMNKGGIKSVVPYGTAGSSRADVALLDKYGNVRHVFDLKTGSATLSAKQIDKYIFNVPGITKPDQITKLK